MLKMNTELQVGNKVISERNAFVIAEVGSNHGQNIDTALQYIKIAAECGADAVKFQYFDADDLVPIDHVARKEVEGYVTPVEWIPKLHEACINSEVIFFASTFNLKLFEILDSSGVLMHKIASSEVLNPGMLLAAGRTMKPTLISFGMSEWYEVELAMKILSETENNQIIPLHCIAKYPLETAEANLLIIEKLRKRFGGLVGFSDHTQSTEIGAWAAMLGARVFEKHITLDNKSTGADHGYALEPKEFQKYVNGIRESISALGTGEKKYLPDEMNGRRRFGARVSANVNPGALIKNAKFDYARPRTEIPANLIELLSDLKVSREIKPGESLTWKDLS
jgi:N,N'-diacetyllegionaminate synthase